MSFCPHCDENHGEGVDFCPRTGKPIVDIAERMIGRTIVGKYKLIRSIGQGGMGTIFEAEHTLIGNKVAVKLLHEPFAEKREPVQRLYREAQATGAVGHPNIINVFDVGETEDGVPFLVMELLKGESLGDHIEQFGPRSLGFVLDVGIQLLSALNAAHLAGIIHRDLKSDNVFLTKTADEKTNIKILDFGISKFIDPEMENLKLTQTGSVLGTPYYMSPEQASGRKNLDKRIDIYSAGVIIYEILIGGIPHLASNYNALLIEIITEDVKPFRWRRSDIPETLEAAVLKALSRDRENRWANALDFMKELVRIRESISDVDIYKEPHLTSKPKMIDRDSHTLDLNDDSLSGISIAFETGGRSATNLLPVFIRSKPALWSVLSIIFIGFIVFLFIPFASEQKVSSLISVEQKISKNDNETAKSDLIVQEQGTESKTIFLKLMRIPQNATATADGKLIPMDGLSMKFSDEPSDIIVFAKGYKSKTISVVANHDLEISVELEKKETSIKRSKKNVRKPKKLSAKKSENKIKVSAQSDVVKTTSTQRNSVKKPKKAASVDRPMDNPF